MKPRDFPPDWERFREEAETAISLFLANGYKFIRFYGEKITGGTKPVFYAHMDNLKDNRELESFHDVKLERETVIAALSRAIALGCDYGGVLPGVNCIPKEILDQPTKRLII